MATIILTDRYGGNPPAWIRSCHECEAMGCSPEPCEALPIGSNYAGRDDMRHVDGARTENCPRPAEHDQPDFDGWHFLRCADCSGTGRVPWYVSVARIPRWIVKGLRFFDQMARPRYRAPHMTQAQHVWLVFKCAFLYDLMRLAR